MRVAVQLAYDGHLYHGYARQPHVKTVEGRIIDILTKTGYITTPKESKFRVASRTDKGVSALGNVVALNTDKNVDNIFEEINIDDHILFYGIKQVDDDFYPRYAKLRIYQYYLKDNNYNLEEILLAANFFTGTHNFSNFARIEEGKNPMRTIENITIAQEDNLFIISFYAQTFLWNQIRRIINSILKTVEKKIIPDDVQKALENHEQKFDFGVAPSEPLVLKDVIYDFDFEHKEKFLRLKKNFEESVFLSIKNFYCQS